MKLTKSNFKQVLKEALKEELANMLNEEDPRVQAYIDTEPEEKRLKRKQKQMQAADAQVITGYYQSDAERAEKYDEKRRLERVQMKLAKQSDKDAQAIVNYARHRAKEYVEKQIGDCIKKMDKYRRIAPGEVPGEYVSSSTQARIEPDVEQFKDCLAEWEADFRKSPEYAAQVAAAKKSSAGQVAFVLVGALTSLSIHYLGVAGVLTLLSGLFESDDESSSSISDEDKDKVVSAAHTEIDKLVAGLL